MSRILNSSFVRGVTVDSVALNEKFVDVASVTAGNIDGDNVRHGAVDQQAILDGTTANGVNGYVLKSAATMDNKASTFGAGAGVAYPHNASPSPAHLSHTGAGGADKIDLSSSPLTLGRLDILRVYWDVRINDSANTGVSNDMLPAQTGAFWLVWLQWDITSASLVNFEAVPGTTDFARTGGGESVEASNTTQGLMIVPHCWREYSIGSGSAVYRKLNLDTSFRQAWYHRRTTLGDITVYGFRLVIDGVYKSTTLAISLDASKVEFDEPSPANWTNAGDYVYFGRITMQMLHMAGG